MPIVFNFLYIFLKKLKLIEPNVSVAEKTLLGRRKLSGGGGWGGGCLGVAGFRGIGVRMKHSKFSNQTLKTGNH